MADNRDSSPDTDPPPLPPRRPDVSRSPRAPKPPTNQEAPSQVTPPRDTRSRSHSPRSLPGQNKYTFTTTRLVSENYQVKRNQRYRSASTESLDSDHFVDSALERSESDPFLLDDKPQQKSPRSFGGSLGQLPVSSKSVPLVYPSNNSDNGNRVADARNTHSPLHVDPYREAYAANATSSPISISQPPSFPPHDQHPHHPQHPLHSNQHPFRSRLSQSGSGSALIHDWPSTDRRNRPTPTGLFYMGPEHETDGSVKPKSVSGTDPLAPDTRSQINDPYRRNLDQDSSRIAQPTGSDTTTPGYHQLRKSLETLDSNTSGSKNSGSNTTGLNTSNASRSNITGSNTSGSNLTNSNTSQPNTPRSNTTTNTATPNPNGRTLHPKDPTTKDPHDPSDVSRAMMRYLSRGPGDGRTVTALATSTALARKAVALPEREEQALVSAVASAEATGDNPYIAVARATARAASIASASAVREAAASPGKQDFFPIYS